MSIFAIEWTVANFVLQDLDLHFQGQAFSCYALSIKKNVQAADFPDRFATTRPVPSWSCSGYFHKYGSSSINKLYNATKSLWTLGSLFMYLIHNESCSIPVQSWLPSTIIANCRDSSCNCYLINLVAFYLSVTMRVHSCFCLAYAYRATAFGAAIGLHGGKNVDATSVLSWAVCIPLVLLATMWCLPLHRPIAQYQALALNLTLRHL